jgi:hypothetical protein
MSALAQKGRSVVVLAANPMPAIQEDQTRPPTASLTK